MCEQNVEPPAQISEGSSGEHIRGMRFEVLTVLAVTVLPLVVISIRRVLRGQTGQFVGSGLSGAVLSSAVHSIVGLLLVAYVIYECGDSLRRFGWRVRPAVIPGSLAVFALAIAGYALVLVLMASLGFLDLESVAHSEDDSIPQGARGILLLLVVVSPLFEETVVRAYLMTRLRDLGLGSTWCVLASTFVQTSYHIHKGLMLLPAYTAIFLVFSLCFARYRNLPIVVLAHLYIDIIWWAIA